MIASMKNALLLDEVRRAIDAALNMQASVVANTIYLPPKNCRGYKCERHDCLRPAYASRLCNAHYIRKKKGRSLDIPLRTRSALGACWKCKTVKAKHGGWGLCARHYKVARRMIIKRACVQIFGGQCVCCNNGNFPTSAFDFHHLSDNKEDSVSDMFSKASTTLIATEIMKCELICANCHRVNHATSDDECWTPS